MKKQILLIGSNSEIAKNLIPKLLEEEHQVLSLSRQESSFKDRENVSHILYDPSSSLPTLKGPLDGLVYFPGTIHLKSFSSFSLDDFQKDLEINFLNCVKALQFYLPLLKESTAASIVFISSVAVKKGLPFHTSISAAKGALEAFTRSLAAELAPKIRVNCVAPSLTKTPLSSSFLDTEKKLEASTKRHPLQRVGNPEDIAEAIYFLLSNKSSWITGQTLGVDGGYGNLSLL